MSKTTAALLLLACVVGCSIAIERSGHVCVLLDDCPPAADTAASAASAPASGAQP